MIEGAGREFTFVMGHSGKDVPAQSVEAHYEDLDLGFAAC